jgi:hypothetical protein
MRLLQIEIVYKALGCCGAFSNIIVGSRKGATDGQNPSAPVRVSDPEQHEPTAEVRAWHAFGRVLAAQRCEAFKSTSTKDFGI